MRIYLKRKLINCQNFIKHVQSDTGYFSRDTIFDEVIFNLNKEAVKNR